MRPPDAAEKTLTGKQVGLCPAYKRVVATLKPLDGNRSQLLAQIVVLPMETIAKAKALNANGASGPLKLAKLLTMELKKSAGHHPDLLPKHHFKAEHQKTARMWAEYRQKRAENDKQKNRTEQSTTPKGQGPRQPQVLIT